MNGLKECSKCGGQMIVRDSRERQGGYIFRRRECQNCPNVIYTTERLDLKSVDITKIKYYEGGHNANLYRRKDYGQPTSEGTV